MKVFRKILKIIIISVMILSILVSCNQNILSTNSQGGFRSPIKVGVVLHTFESPYMFLIRQDLEEIQKENSGKVEFTFWDSQENESKQNEIIDRLLLQENVNLLILNLVDVNENTVNTVINKVKQKNIPIIFYYWPEPAKMNSVKEYKKAFVVASDSKQAGMLEGQILVNIWNNNKAAIDKNGDNIMQYIMLKGPHNLEVADDRTKYSILAINNAGIKTSELASQVCNWDREIAKNTIDSLFLGYSRKIEAIIANNDNMAIGAIEALQKYGYNKGDKNKTITVVGIDAIPEARDLIKKGFMAGTVFQDPYAEAKDLYTIGMNLVYNRNPVEGTKYKLEKDEKIIYMPYQEYKGE